jgi:molybdopterin/thiamine biosynthesis adenylyltransferase
MVSKAFVIVVGTGGIGSVVVAALSRTLSKDSVLMLIDGDRFERRNVARQMLFADATEGEFKADVLTRKYTWEHGPFITPVHGYICDKASEREERDGGVIIDTLASMLAPYDDTIDESFGGEATIICCSDNHAARRRCLTHGSMNRWGVILSGNELVVA